ncbi:MAG TPA: hypothetical protein VME24_06395 [Alphaproteobacteria bacterium]|nr:hypothetical protein [Alphaproteobacteria bacterium]
MPRLPRRRGAKAGDGATGCVTAIANDSSGNWSTNTSTVTVILTNSFYGYDQNGSPRKITMLALKLIHLEYNPGDRSDPTSRVSHGEILTNDGFKHFAYDDENELIAVWVTNAWSNSFAYDGKMRRRIERDYSWDAGTSGWTETNEVHFIYDGNLVVEERNASNVPLVSYTRGLDLSGTFQGAGGIGGLLRYPVQQSARPTATTQTSPQLKPTQL